MDSSEIYSQVREHYSSASRSTSVKYGETVAKSFGYSADELSAIPSDANLGLSCGNPLAIASLKEGETVIDLGSGAGFDIFLASPKVGLSGRAIGIDMNDDMLARANQILATSPSPTKSNITFLRANIAAALPLPSDTVDCAISNCVINLVPAADKPAVFTELLRVLKPGGGRVAVSDILAKKPLPEDLKRDMALYVGCIAGASEVGEYEAWLRGAGFDDVMIVDTGADLNVYLETAEDGEKKGGCCDPAPAGSTECCVPKATVAGKMDQKKGDCCEPAPAGSAECCVPKATVAGKMDLNEFVGSYKIFAVKK
ncbi:NAD(P)-binding protein [Parathielavia hyrcaniae]|uniref:Arsenite methyltransferase n=1 Tax=Parathielavia hyrcaniae TaxID=113614 RepID=A0AAN6PT93_9PEZI|nr:NAD(P)-binding protein [Parathielavia hyrcaniae]